MKRILAIWLLVLAASGCAFFRQAKSDYDLNKTTPYMADETTVDDQSRALTGTISAIPYANLATPIVALGGPFIFGWLRGRKIRKRKAESGANGSPDALAASGSPSAVDSFLKILNDARAGIFEAGPDGSALKRGWKIALLSSLGLVLAPEIGRHVIPFVNAHHPAWLNGAALSMLIGALAAAEKQLSKTQIPA